VIYCYHYICFTLSLFSDIKVSQGSVATLVRCVGIFNANFIANFLKSQPVKELWKSADIWRSYRKSKKGDVFLKHRVVCHARKYDHVTHLLRDLHWLRVPERIQFRLSVLASAVATTRRLRILLMISIGLTARNHGIDYGPVPVHAWLFRQPGSAPSAIDHFAWLARAGRLADRKTAVFLSASQHQPLCRLSRDDLKLFFIYHV